MILPLTIVLLIWLLPISVNVYLDRNGAKRNYLQVFILRGIAAVAHGILFGLEGWHSWSLKEVFSNPFWAVLAFQVTSYWIIFEFALNLVRGRHVLYYDQKEGDSGYIDKLFKRLGPLTHLIAKFIALGTLIWSIIKLYGIFT